LFIEKQDREAYNSAPRDEKALEILINDMQNFTGRIRSPVVAEDLRKAEMNNWSTMTHVMDLSLVDLIFQAT
jgi:hypothetical protein